jgi:phage tail-like protein
MSTVKRTDPYGSFNFDVELVGSKELIGSFSEVSGLEANTEFEEYREGGLNEFTHKLPTITKYPNLILKRGITQSDILYKWYLDVLRGSINRRAISVILLDEQRQEAKKWTFNNAFPIKWSASNLTSTSNSLEIETVELVHQGLYI